MRVIVTRPEREAWQWVRELSALGFEALALPLIKVAPVDDPANLVQAWQQLAGYDGVMFVSGNAVAHFFAAKPPLAPEFIGLNAIKTRAWATGPGTARALLREGVPIGRIDVPADDAAQFDTEALWQLVGAQLRVGSRVLIVRGADTAGSDSAAQGTGREWFANRVVQAGAKVDFLVAYQRCAPVLGRQDDGRARQAASDGSVWLFSSSEAVANLSTAVPGQYWDQARALATHPRIAAAAKKAGFAVVCESRPTLPDMVASLKDMACAQASKIQP